MDHSEVWQRILHIRGKGGGVGAVSCWRFNTCIGACRSGVSSHTGFANPLNSLRGSKFRYHSVYRYICIFDGPNKYLSSDFNVVVLSGGRTRSCTRTCRRQSWAPYSRCPGSSPGLATCCPTTGTWCACTTTSWPSRRSCPSIWPQPLSCTGRRTFSRQVGQHTLPHTSNNITEWKSVAGSWTFCFVSISDPKSISIRYFLNWKVSINSRRITSISLLKSFNEELPVPVLCYSIVKCWMFLEQQKFGTVAISDLDPVPDSGPVQD